MVHEPLLKETLAVSAASSENGDNMLIKSGELEIRVAPTQADDCGNNLGIILEADDGGNMVQEPSFEASEDDLTTSQPPLRVRREQVYREVSDVCERWGLLEMGKQQVIVLRPGHSWLRTLQCMHTYPSHPLRAVCAMPKLRASQVP